MSSTSPNITNISLQVEMPGPLDIQKFLQGRSLLGKSLEEIFTELEEKYHIIAKQHSRCPGLYLFKYSQLDSNFALKIVQECRGIILDSKNNWGIVACPYFKFFNVQESLAAKIDWSTAKVQEKLDGSLISMYYYNNKWHVATSGCPDGTNQIGNLGKTFDDLFWDCFKWSCRMLNPTYTYMWELTSPMNRVVVDHKNSNITLIGVRDNKTLQELPVRDFEDKFPIVYEWPLATLENCLEAANKLNPLEHEGFVCVDAQFNRVKIKSPHYVALHHLKDSCSLSKIAEVIRAGEYQEFATALEAYPDIKKKFYEIVDKYENIVKWSLLTYTLISYIKDQKEFALEALKSPYSNILFAMRKTGKSPQAIIKNLTTNAYLRLLGVKE